MNAKDILKKMKDSNQKNSGDFKGSDIPVLKLPFNEPIVIKIIRDTKTDPKEDPFIVNAIHIKNALLPSTAQCNIIFNEDVFNEEVGCPLCDLHNDDEWNNFKWEQYHNDNKELWKLMMGIKSKWMTHLLVVPVDEIYKTSPSSEIHKLFLWEQEVQDFLEQYIRLDDKIKENINKTYFTLTRFKSKQGYRIKIEPVTNSKNINVKLSKERIAVLKKELEDIPSLKERVNIPESPLSKEDLYFKVIKPFRKSIDSLSSVLMEDVYNTLVNIVDRVFEPYMIDENALNEKMEKEEDEYLESILPSEPQSSKETQLVKENQSNDNKKDSSVSDMIEIDDDEF